jgi:hypothetical protein
MPWMYTLIEVGTTNLNWHNKISHVPFIYPIKKTKNRSLLCMHVYNEMGQ